MVYRLAAWRRPAPMGAGMMSAISEGRGRARLSYRGDERDQDSRCLHRRTWLLRTAAACGASRATLREEACLSNGDDACEYVVTWVEKARVAPAAIAGLASAGGLLALSAPALLLVLAPMTAAMIYVFERWRVASPASLAGVQADAAFRSLVARARPDCSSTVSIEREHHVWRIEFQGTTTRLRHSRGLALLAHLIRTPGCDIHVSALDAITPSGGSRGPETGVMAAPGDAGEILDAQARTQYRRRAAELRAELADAEHGNDLGRIEALRAEREMLEDQLRAAVGAGGRPRRASSDSERLRVAITHRIRDAIAQIAKSDPALGAHLTKSVSTGYRCAYEPRAGESEQAIGERERKA